MPSTRLDLDSTVSARAGSLSLAGGQPARETLPDRVWPKDIPHPPKRGRGGVPAILSTLSDRLERYLNAPAEWIPSLNAANGSRRQQRSERRIACVQLLRAMLKFCDLASLRIGVPQSDGRWLNLTLPYLSLQAGLPLRRAERALQDLQAAGLSKLRRQCEKRETSDGVTFRGLAAIKYLPPSIFEAFGLGARLRTERSKAQLRAQRYAASAARARRKQQPIARTLLDALSKPRARASTSARAEDAYRRSVMLAAGQAKAQHPEWTRDECYAFARRTVSPPDGGPA